MPAAENHLLSAATNDTWRTWLMTGVRRSPADRRRMRGDHAGLKQMLLEGMSNGDDRPHGWKGFSGAMIRHAVEEGMRSLPQQDKQVVKLAYFGGFSNREIAGQVGLSEATVQRRLRSALSTISEHLQHGRALGRRAAYAALVWLGGRWLHDAAHQLVQVTAIAGAAAIIAAQPAAGRVTAPSHSSAQESRAHVTTTTLVPPIQSPAAPAAVPSVLPIQVPASVPLPVEVPALPSLPVALKKPVL